VLTKRIFIWQPFLAIGTTPPVISINVKYFYSVKGIALLAALYVEWILKGTLWTLPPYQSSTNLSYLRVPMRES
jgi:hypothetical protein